MRIVFNSKSPEAASTAFYQAAFSRMNSMMFFDYEHFDEYDVALFMTYKDDLDDLRTVKRRYPSLITAIIDPRGVWVEPYLKYADFLIVDSLEMRDYWSGSNLPILEYAEYPDLRVQQRNHLEKKEKIVIGYHGNRIHLESMIDTIFPALEKLSRKYDIEMWAMYNISSMGKWEKNVPDIQVNHIQWSLDNYYKYLSQVDIGIVPCFLPERRFSGWRQWPILKKFNPFNKTSDDYLLRFKMPTNPGRIIVFGILNIPVVSDFFPSAMQCIDEGNSGALACTEGGWHRALENLITDGSLRQRYADNLSVQVARKYSFSVQNAHLIKFLNSQFRFATKNENRF